MRTVAYFAGAVLVVVHFACASPVVDAHKDDGHIENLVQHPSDYNQLEEGLLRKLNSKCAQRDVTSCVMLKLVTYMNNMLKKSSIEVNSDLEITQTTTTVNLEQTARSLPDNIASMSDEAQITQLIANKVWNFVRSRSLKYKLLEDADLVLSTNPEKDGTLNVGVSIKAARALEKGRGKMKNLGPLLAAGAMKIGLLGALAFKGLALLVGKALILSKIALLLAGIIGLKKLFSGQKHVTYEVVSHPHHSHSHAYSESGGGHDSYSSGWGRSIAETAAAAAAAQDMAFSAQKPAASRS